MRISPLVLRALKQRNSPIFWNWPSKTKPDQQKCVAFQKSQESSKSLHPTEHAGFQGLFSYCFCINTYCMKTYKLLIYFDEL